MEIIWHSNTGNHVARSYSKDYSRWEEERFKESWTNWPLYLAQGDDCGRRICYLLVSLASSVSTFATHYFVVSGTQ